jgi:hypothetical protein
MIDQREKLRYYFAPERWESSMEKFTVSGRALVERIRSLRPKFVIDAGCGFHPFREDIWNCIGIDFVNPCADLICDFAEAPIRDGSIDVVLALGSVNFGDEENVVADLTVLARWLRPGGKLFMRGNPGQPLADESITVFPWHPANIGEIGRSAGLELVSKIEEEHLVTPWGADATRLAWVYERV